LCNNESTYELIDSTIPFNLTGNHKNKIYKFTNGQPYYTVAICRKISEQYTLDRLVSTSQINYCIMNEIFSNMGSINEHFEYILDISFARFKNKDKYKTILFLLSQNPANLATIARYMKKPSGEISNYLKALLKTDVIFRIEGVYHIREPLFSFWINNKYLGLITDITSEKVIEHLLANLEEKYQKISTKLGIAKEYEIKYKLEELYNIELKISAGMAFLGHGVIAGGRLHYELKRNLKEGSIKRLKQNIELLNKVGKILKDEPELG
jgi:DNA-binding Lrp family transcriptional regulator